MGEGGRCDDKGGQGDEKKLYENKVLDVGRLVVVNFTKSQSVRNEERGGT